MDCRAKADLPEHLAGAGIETRRVTIHESRKRDLSRRVDRVDCVGPARRRFHAPTLVPAYAATNPVSTWAEINQTLVSDLAAGGFIAQHRNVVLVGGTGTGKTHLAIAIVRSCIRSGARGRWRRFLTSLMWD